MRVGLGYDVHKLVENRKLILGLFGSRFSRRGRFFPHGQAGEAL